MRFLPYVLKHLRRNWIRAGSTALAITVCIFLFCTLQTVLHVIDLGLQGANASRLITRHKVSLVFNLPLKYKARIAALPGVTGVATANWFYGFLGSEPDFKTFFPNFAVDAEEYLHIFPEYVLTPEEKKNFLTDRRGCIVGEETAERFDWKVGDTFQLESVIPPYRTGRPFQFIIRGIYRARDEKTDPRIMFFHHAYLHESTKDSGMTPAGVQAGTFAVQLDDPSRAGEVSRAIDERFENSEAQTRTETEAAFMADFVSLAGNLALLLNAIGLAVTFTILLVTANTMSMAVRERRTEIAVLKTLGFSNRLVMLLLLGESTLLGSLGGALGIFAGVLGVQILTHVPFIQDLLRQYPNLVLPAPVAALALALSLGLGLASGLIPALGAYRSRIADTLRTV